MAQNYYEVLGVPPEASADEIKKAFRTMAAKNHPDRNQDDPGAEGRFKQVNEAWQTLGDEAKKAEYDLRQSVGGGHFGGPFGDPFGRGMEDVMEELLRRKAAGRGAWTPPGHVPPGHVPRPEWIEPEPGEEINASVDVSFEESLAGGKRTVRVRGMRPTEECPSCDGKGAQRATRTVACGSCGGKGFKMTSGLNTRRCSTCRGRGQVPLVPCRSCAGSGRTAHEREISVAVPAGIDDGQVLRVAGQGGPGTPPGDLFVKVRVTPSNEFRRNGMDILTVKEVTMRTAILGGSFVVRSPYGDDVEVPVEPGTQPGSVVTVPGHGVRQTLGTRKGDLQVAIKVALPRRLSARGKKLLEELVEELSRGPDPQ